MLAIHVEIFFVSQFLSPSSFITFCKYVTLRVFLLYWYIIRYILSSCKLFSFNNENMNRSSRDCNHLGGLIACPRKLFPCLCAVVSIFN